MKLDAKIAPNFMIIGAQKSGTTWLHRMLRQHPDICFAREKELHFFNLKHNYDRGMNWYYEQFNECAGKKAIGEATPNYLWICQNEYEINQIGVIPHIAERVHEQFPDLKLIVSLREPVSRAISSYYHMVRSLRVKPAESMLSAGETNGIISMGYYKAQIEEWLAYFPREQFLFLVYETDIVHHKRSTLAHTFRFLGVDDTFVPDDKDKRWNRRTGHLHMRLKHISPRVAYAFFLVFPFLREADFPRITLDEGELKQLAELYAQENAGLADLIERDLPWAD